MDYLDPRKRRAYHIRLVVGYILVAIVIGLGTIIIVYGANGYGFNTKTGQIVQNGLVFVDSQPSGAAIYLNNDEQGSNTSARLILPAGNYTLTLKKAGYRNWSSEFILNGQTVARYAYPFLFPVTPVTTNLKTYTSNPGLITQTPNQQWLLVENNEASTTSPVFDEYDTTTLDKTTPSVQQVSIPAGILTNYSSASALKEVEWSTDNNNLLLQHTYSGGNEFIVFNRAHPDQSFNVNTMFGANPSQVNLFNKSTSQLYIYNQDGTLQLGDTSAKTLGPVLLKQVLAFKPYGKNLITYVTKANEPVGMVAARIWSNGTTYKLNEFTAGTTYLIDAAQYQGNFYYAASSNTVDRVNIYKNPLNDLQNPSTGKALPKLALHITGAQQIGFSKNARLIGAENGQRFAVYDIETGSLYQYPLSNQLASNMAWMDGNRFIGESDGKIFVMDFDGTNKQRLVPTNEAVGGLFSANYNHLLTTATAPDGTSVILQDVDMRAGTDLPTNKQPSS
ncbi:MAG: PEGA domain-containing protein [Candidatus Saccharimonadales bacterium]